MKKRMWGPEKCDVILREAFSRPIYRGINKNKIRRRRLVRMKLQEKRPAGGYPVYWVRRSKPYNTINSESFYEDSEHFWNDCYGE